MQSTCRWIAVVLASAVAIGTAACADQSGPAAPTVEAVAERPSAGDILGGDAAVGALRAMIARLEGEGRLGEVPAGARAIVERVRRDDLVPQLRPSFLTSVDGEEISGPYVIEGDTYYELDGVLYPPEEKKALVHEPYTTGKLEPYRAEVSAGFSYWGHDATQQTTWQIRNPRTGTIIRSFPLQTFGSKSTQLFGLLKVFTGHVVITGLPACDMELTAHSNHEAWYLGGWQFADEVSGSSSGTVGIKIVRGKRGTDYKSSGMSPQTLLCPDPPPDACVEPTSDDPGSNSDGAAYSLTPTGAARVECVKGGTGTSETQSGCTLCQQWFEVDEYYNVVYEWWECHEITDPGYCEWLMS